MTSRPRRKPDAALVAVTLGITLSLVANVLATLPDPVRVVGGVAASLTLPASVHLWRAVPVDDQWWWVWLRGLVMFGIAALAALVSFVHASALLVAHGEQPLLAVSYPVGVELLVVMGVLARRTVKPAAKSRPARAPRTAKTTTSQVQAAPGSAVAPDKLLADARDLRAPYLAAGKRYGRGKLAADLGVSQDCARKLLEELAQEPARMRAVS